MFFCFDPDPWPSLKVAEKLARMVFNRGWRWDGGHPAVFGDRVPYLGRTAARWVNIRVEPNFFMDLLDILQLNQAYCRLSG